MSRANIKKKEREAAIKRRLKKQQEDTASAMKAAPIQTFKQVPKDKRAAAILRRLQREAKKPEQLMPYDKPSSTRRQRVIGAAGIESAATISELPNTGGARRHDVDFARVDAEENIFEPRKNLSKKNAALRRANIKYQQGVLLDKMKPNDLVTATPLEGSGKHNARARIYERATKGALKARVKPDGSATIGSLKTGPDTWLNEAKQVKKFNPKDLMKDLIVKGSAQAIIKRLGGPKAQAAMLIDDASEALTGERISKRALEHYRDHIEPEIKKRLRKGQRVTPVSPLSYRR